MGNKSNFIIFKGAAIHRYLRLTPLYFMTLMVYIYIFPVVGNGDHFGDGSDMHRRLSASAGPHTNIPVDKHELNFCQKYWWTNLLYISNFYPNQLGAHGTTLCISSACLHDRRWPLQERNLATAQLTMVRTAKPNSVAWSKHGTFRSICNYFSSLWQLLCCTVFTF